MLLSSSAETFHVDFSSNQSFWDKVWSKFIKNGSKNWSFRHIEKLPVVIGKGKMKDIKLQWHKFFDSLNQWKWNLNWNGLPWNWWNCWNGLKPCCWPWPSGSSGSSPWSNFCLFSVKKKKKLFTWNYCEIAKMKQETKKKKSLIFCNWKNFHQVIFTAAWRKLKFPSLCNTYSAYCCLIEWIIIKMTDPLFLNTFIECPFVTLDV